MGEGAPPRWSLWAVLGLAVVAYLPALGGEFVFDDYALLSDPAVVEPAGPLELIQPERTRPLTYLSFWLNRQLGGTSPAGWHAVNLGLHLALVALLYGLVRRIAGDWTALAAAAVVALHPLQTEAVSYVYGRAVVLAAIFVVLSWRAWLAGKHGQAVGWFAAALLAKEEAAAFPVFLAGYDWFFEKVRGKAWRARLGPLAAMLTLTAAAAFRVAYAVRVSGGESGALSGLGDVTPGTYLLTQGRVLWLYLRLLVAPVGQNFDRDVTLATGPEPAALAGWAALAALFFGCLWLARRRPAFFWVAGGLILFAPTSSVAPLADLAAERRVYLPLLAFAPAVGTLVSRLRYRPVLVGVLAVGLAGLTFARNQVWTSEIALWRDTVAKSPDKARPKLQLARALEGKDATAERRALLQAAVAVEPENPTALTELGVFELERRRPAEALERFQRALEIEPGDAQLRAYLGSGLLLLGRPAEAIEAFQSALELDPCNFDARNNLLFVSRSSGIAEVAPGPPPPGCRFTPAQRRALEAAE